MKSPDEPAFPPPPIGFGQPGGDVTLSSFNFEGSSPKLAAHDLVPTPSPDYGEDDVTKPKAYGDGGMGGVGGINVSESHTSSQPQEHSPNLRQHHSPSLSREARVRIQRVIVYLIMFVVYTGVGILCCWFNWLVGMRGLWGLSFLIALVVAPILFFLPVIPLLCADKVNRHCEVFLFLMAWGTLFLLGISFPIAVTGGRTKVANELATMEAPLAISANCWEYNKPPISANDWNNKVEFIIWGDSEWYVDEVHQRWASYTEEGATYTYCAAPIRLRPASQVRNNCTGFLASALCYEQQKTAGPCSAAALAACVWNLRGNNVGYSRVLRPHAFYKSYGDKVEYKYSDRAVQAAMSAVANVSGPYKVLPVQWGTDQDPQFFMDKIGALDYSIWLQYIIYISVWAFTSLCGFLVVCIRTAD